MAKGLSCNSIWAVLLIIVVLWMMLYGGDTKLRCGAAIAGRYTAIINNAKISFAERMTTLMDFSVLGVVYPDSRWAFRALCISLDYQKQNSDADILVAQCYKRQSAIDANPDWIWILRRWYPLWTREC